MEEPPDEPESEKEQMKKLLTPEEFGRQTVLSTAFVRLLIECGCPTSNGKFSHESFATWLPENFGCVRDAAGLEPLPTPDTALNEKERADLCVDGYLYTIMDFGMSRCSNPRLKEAYARIKTQMHERRKREE